MNSSLQLTIRCANQANEDLKINEAKSDWTVKQLKIYLCDVHPSKPAPERQRIVFAGQLLRDEARLTDYFQRYDNADSSTIGKTPEPYVLHLVYTTSVEENVAAAQRRQAANKESELRQRKVLTSTTSAANESVQPNISSSNTASSSYTPAYWPWMATGQQPQMSMAAATTPDLANDWMRQQQQMQAAMNMMMSQWYGQYMQAAYGTAAGFYPVQGQMLQQPNMGFGNIGGQQPLGQQVEPIIGQQPEVPRAQAPPQQAMNAQGGLAPADDEDDPRNRDWLDYIYMACRARKLIMILYFYSSIERFVFVLLCCTLMYGLQAGWFGRRGGQQQPRNVGEPRVIAPPLVIQQEVQNARVPLNNQPPNQIAAAEDADGGGGERERAIGVGEEGQVGVDGRQQQEPPPIRNTPPEITMTAWNVFWSTCWTFISSFFASLVPERPPPLNM